MGGGSSKYSGRKKYDNPYASTNLQKGYETNRTQATAGSKSQAAPPATAGSKSQAAPPQVAERKQEPREEEREERVVVREVSAKLSGDGYASSDDEFYDGIPRFRRTLSQKSRSRRHKVSEVSSLLGRAGSAGLGRAAGVLDTLGSTMNSLNPTNGFATGATVKNNELSILCFEVANTIVKGSNIMQSLSRRSIRVLKEVVLPSEGVQKLVSTDTAELLTIVAADKREELKIFAGEVVRFGNRCKDPQWHNLDRFFEKHSRARTPQRQLQDEAESMMQKLMVLVQHTAELYQELHTLDRFEEDYQFKRIVEFKPTAGQRGNSLAVMAAEIKTQRKLVRNLKKKSLWSRSLEEVMEKLVDIVLFLNREISNTFGNTDDTTDKGSLVNQHKLGPAGLALHYANIILLIDSILARSSSMPPNARDTLYQNLPPSIKSSLRSKLQSFHVKEELSITDIKAEMEKALHWLVPIATNTAKAHHGFGWVGEWANTGSELNRQSVGPMDIIQIETLHHANRQKTEAYILELLLRLNYLVSRSKKGGSGGNARSSVNALSSSPVKETVQQPKQKAPATTSTTEDQKILQDVGNEKQTQGTSKSQDNSAEKRSKKFDEVSKSSSDATSQSNELTQKMPPSSIPLNDFCLKKEEKLDMIDRVETHRQTTLPPTYKQV